MSFKLRLVSFKLPFFFKSFFFFLLPFCSFLFLNLSGFWVSSPISKTVFVPPSSFIEYLHLGHNDSLADLLWLRLIQDFDVCGQEKVSKFSLKDWIPSLVSSPPLSLSDEVSGTEKKGIQAGLRKLASDFFLKDSKVCFKGWMYQMLDAISKLAPRFYVAYSVGATSLSVLGNDPVGAKLIFDRGIDNFPRDWQVLYRAAYHYLYELLDMNKAADLLRKAQSYGAPDWVNSLAARLYTQVGQLNMALTLLFSYEKTLEDEKMKKKVRKRIQKLLDKKEEIEKKRNNRLFKYFFKAD